MKTPLILVLVSLSGAVLACNRQEEPAAKTASGQGAQTGSQVHRGCAMTAIPGLRTDVAAVENGVRLTLAGPASEVDKIRGHARMMASMHQGGDDMGMPQMMVPSSRVNVEETADGARLTFVGKPDQLRAPVEKHARMLATGDCPMMGM